MWQTGLVKHQPVQSSWTHGSTHEWHELSATITLVSDIRQHVGMLWSERRVDLQASMIEATQQETRVTRDDTWNHWPSVTDGHDRLTDWQIDRWQGGDIVSRVSWRICFGKNPASTAAQKPHKLTKQRLESEEVPYYLEDALLGLRGSPGDSKTREAGHWTAGNNLWILSKHRCTQTHRIIT